MRANFKPLGLAAAVAVATIAYASASNAAGFREQRAWQFMDPITKAVVVQREAFRRLNEGGFYEGSHANKVIYIDEVRVDDVSGSLHYQTNTTVGNQTTIVQQGDGTLTYDGSQATGDQGSTNTSQGNVVGAQGENANINQSGSQTQGDWILNGGS